MLGHEDHVKLGRRTPVKVPHRRPMVPHLVGNLRDLRGVLAAGALGRDPGAGGGGAGRRGRGVAHEVAADVLLHAPVVVLERLPIQLVTFRRHALVEEHVWLCALHLLRAYQADLQVVELVPLLWFPLVLAVGDVVTTAHRADVLDDADEPVFHRMRRRVLEEGRHIQRLADWESHHSRVLCRVEPAGIIAEALDVDAQYLRQVLECEPPLSIRLPLAELAVVLVLPYKGLCCAELSQTVRNLDALVVEPTLDLACHIAKHACPRRPPAGSSGRQLTHGPRAAGELVGVRDLHGDVVDGLLSSRCSLALQAPHGGDHVALKQLRDDGGVMHGLRILAFTVSGPFPASTITTPSRWRRGALATARGS
mmetsp:Transcript_149027/g.371296  ORF Transcript_149027/g.371296 Transcript_149027/m.371296 type:complete len:366 (+) Transcript_149027:1083-2180(+)